VLRPFIALALLLAFPAAARAADDDEAGPLYDPANVAVIDIALSEEARQG
jgi:hypothetical protein